MKSSEEDEWKYLSAIIEHSNNDDDLTENVQDSASPKTVLEEQIQRLAVGDAPLTYIAKLTPGKVHIHGSFRQMSGRYVRQGLHVTDAIISDDTGSARVVWFNQPYKSRYVRTDVIYELRGTYGLQRGRFQISNAKIRPLTAGCKPFERNEKG